MDEERIRKGREIQRRALGRDAGQNTIRFKDIAPAYYQSIAEYCWGTIWGESRLDRKTCSFVVIAAATAQDNPKEVEMHTRSALNHGATREEIADVIVQCAPYVGIPKTNHALYAAMNVFDQWDQRDDWRGV